MWPLPNVETEANGTDLWSANERGPFLGWFVGLVVPVQGVFYPALAALVSPVQNIFFHTVHFFTSCVSIANQPGQAVVPDRLSLGIT